MRLVARPDTYIDQLPISDAAIDPWDPVNFNLFERKVRKPS